MSYDLNQYLVREYEKLDSELEQREFVEKMRFLMMAKEKDFSGYYSRRNLAGREFYSVIDTLYELNNLWMLSGFIRQNHQVLLRETQEGTEYRKKPDFTEICRIGKDAMLSRMFQVMGKFPFPDPVSLQHNLRHSFPTSCCGRICLYPAGNYGNLPFPP